MSQHWFTADEHYGHQNIITFCKRPFADVETMREVFIASHNAKVGKEDTTHHVGDMFWRTLTVKEAQSILSRLNGKHILYWGNHDEVARQVAGMFETTRETALIKPRAQFPSIWISHYAHRVWPKSHKGSWHVFGHTHNELPDFRYSHDVGVDANGYAPVSLDDLAERFARKTPLLHLEPCPAIEAMNRTPWVPEPPKPLKLTESQIAYNESLLSLGRGPRGEGLS